VPSSLLGVVGVLASAQVVVAHGNHNAEKIAEGEATSKEPMDSILWIHILLMMLSFGIIFPTGMVLGVGITHQGCRSQLIGGIDCKKQVACTGADTWDHYRCSGILFGTSPQRASFCAERTRLILQLADAHTCCPNSIRNIPQVPSHERDPWKDQSMAME
jgi:hypothetical protein